jgi:hypothetical protein
MGLRPGLSGVQGQRPWPCPNPGEFSLVWDALRLIGSVLSLAACATAPANAELASTLCRPDGHGRFFVALGAEVLALSQPYAVLEQSPPARIVELVDGGVVRPNPGPAAVTIAPPDPAGNPGCLYDPVQRLIVVLSLEAIAPGDSGRIRADRLDLSLSTAVGSGARIGGPSGVAFSPSTHASSDHENLYIADQEAFCAKGQGTREPQRNAPTCFYRPYGKPLDGWVGRYTTGRDPSRIDPFATAFICAPDYPHAAWTRCAVRYRLMAEYDLPWTFIDAVYTLSVNAPSPASLIDQVLAYDARLRRALSQAIVPNYPWPAMSLAAWTAAQPKRRWMARFGNLIVPSRH